MTAVTMATTPEAPPAFKGGPHLTVSWRRPGSKKWQPFEDSLGPAILAATASGQATFQLEESLRRSPRLNPEERKAKRARASRRSSKEVDLVVTLKTDRNGCPASNSERAVRWGFSSTCSFDRLPRTARALAAMIADCEAPKKRQVLSELLDFLTSEERIHKFLSEIDFAANPVQWFPSLTACAAKTGTLRISRITVNARARPGGALYARFLDAMARHVADLGDALRSLMGSDSQKMAPLLFAFHGTPPPNVPSILENGMLPEKRIASGGDWFGTLPFASLSYCQKQWGCGVIGGPPFRLILFLLLPVPSAVLSGTESWRSQQFGQPSSRKLARLAGAGCRGRPQLKGFPEEAAADPMTPAPSVVIVWVLSELFEVPWQPNEVERLRREVQLEAHAVRLGKSWETYGDTFVNSFAKELMLCVQDVSHQHSNLSALTDFLARLFGACPSNPSLHIRRGSQELWPSVLEEFRRKHEQLSQGTERAAPATTRWREKSLEFLRHLDYSIPYIGTGDEVSNEVSRRLRGAVEKVRAGLLNEKSKIRQAQEEVIEEAEEAQMRAKRALVKASLEKAPWEKGALSGERRI
ncbi:hypothetical protein KFL_004040150 [Klebsormidium nitens]|uniref:Uncharacterized protein n=1 Tax=Klebsormidium nitens TaxID=105231 RepID=A0A1Y1IB13_KLENI|nr:hypothetical protein KFL_004040150 [Klebsormidium nitens]|eukprot:GAQ88155.1 hypothetical protein KFL_004040150 [Klebsormidium nitens]